jgi:putative hemolysin
MTSQKKHLHIDIQKVLASKGVKNAPRFLVRLLKRIIHQDELNELLSRCEGLTGVAFAQKALEHLDVKYNIHNPENIPLDGGRYIFASNHPLGGLDGLIMISLIGEKMGDVRFVVNDLLMFIKPLEDIFVPVSKFKRMSQEYADKINSAFESDAQMLYFPAGLCSRLIKGKVMDLEWKKTFVTKAIEYHRGIIPVHFSGENTRFFYRLAKLRKYLGIKFNIEMILLVDEMFKKRGHSFDIYIRKPIPSTDITKEKNALQWTEHIRKLSYGTSN